MTDIKDKDYSQLSVEEMALEERKFLHELSNLLVVAHGMSTFVQQSLLENPNSNPADVEKMNKVMDSVNKINRLVRNRRSILHSITIK